jgi:hypothetical protein
VWVPFGSYVDTVDSVKDHDGCPWWAEGRVIPDEFATQGFVGRDRWVSAGWPHEIEGNFNLILDAVPFVARKSRVGSV